MKRINLASFEFFTIPIVLILLNAILELKLGAQTSFTWIQQRSGVWPIYAMAVAPVTPASVLVEDGFEIIQSTDGGSTWRTSSDSSFAGNAIAFTPGDSSIVYSGHSHGILKSVDGGSNWFSLTDLNAGSGAGAIVVDPKNSSAIYAGVSDGWGVYKSLNAGATWSNPLTSRDVRTLAIRPTDSSIYAGTATYDGQSGGVLKSVDGGQSWTSVWTNNRVNALAIDPINPEIVYAGTQSEGVFKSTDGGASWSQAGSVLTNLPISALLVDPVKHTQIYATTSGAGFYMSSDSGNTWTAVNSGLTDLNALCLAVHPPTGTLYVGTYSGSVFVGTPLNQAPENQLPSFTKGPDITVNENSGPQRFANWATGINLGSDGQADQMLTFLVSSSNPSLFAVQPAIDASGTLTFTSATNAVGSASVAASVTGNGGTTAGSPGSSVPQTFEITLLAAGVEEYIYWSTGDGQLKRANTDGTSIETILSGAERRGNGVQGMFGGIAIDSQNGYLYTGDPRHLIRARLDGSERTNLVNLTPWSGSQVGITEVRWDSLHGKVYWVDMSTTVYASIWRVNPDGTNLELVMRHGDGSIPPWTVVGMAIDPLAGKLFYSEVAFGNIWVSALDGSGETKLRNDGLNIGELDLDPSTGYLYFSATPQVRKAKADGTGSISTVLTYPSLGNALHLDLSTSRMYFSDGNGVILRAALDGSQVQPLLTESSRFVNYIGLGSALALPVTPTNEAPTVAIVSPGNGASYLALATVTITANATDSDGSVSQVEFFQGTNKLGTVLSAPYSLIWSNVSAGAYSLTAKATDNLGATGVSAPVNITVTNPPPTISAIADQTTPQDTPTPPIPFTVSDLVTPAANLLLSADSSNKSLLPVANIALGGAGANRTVTLTPAASASGKTTITITVTDGGGLSASTAFVLTVTPSNRPPTVTITSPSNGATFTAPANLTITANATDSDGSVSQVEFFQGTNKLGTVLSAPYSLSWSNVSAGAYALTAKATDNLGATGVSAPVNITVTNASVPLALTISIQSPPNRASFCPETDIPILALVTNAAGAVTVEFFSGSSSIGIVTSNPYQFTWLKPPPGDYSFTVKTTDSQGNTATSSPVNITVSEICGDVAIVRNFPDPEIDALQNDLFEMGLSSRVFDQAGLTFEALHGYRLIIWDDLGVVTNGLSANDVTVFERAYTNGIPLYFIGERLASSTTNLPKPQQVQWISLTHLNPATGVGGDGLVQVQSTVDYNLILNGRFFVVGNFAYPKRVDLAKAADTDVEVFGTSGGEDLLLAYPGLEIADTGQVRTFTQNVRVLASDAAGSEDTLKGLFQNVVCWLLRCPQCGDVDVSLDARGPVDPVPAGQPFEYDLAVSHNGECEATGTVVTSVLPVGVQFVGAESAQGKWSYDPTSNTVTFLLGHLAKSSTTELKLTVLPIQDGVLTNVADVRINGPEVTLDNNRAEVVTVVEGGTAVVMPSLSIRALPAAAYQLSLSGPGGLTFEIQSSSDLVHWRSVTNITGADWSATLSMPSGLNSPPQFFRASMVP